LLHATETGISSGCMGLLDLRATLRNLVSLLAPHFFSSYFKITGQACGKFLATVLKNPQFL